METQWLIRCLILVNCFTNGQRLSGSIQENGLCKDIEANYSSFKQLTQMRHCEVVIGNIRLYRIFNSNSNSEYFKNISFPYLREVTGYILIFQVVGLYSLGDMFPNLTRIRGNQLFYNYALIVYDNSNLLEVNLYSLLKIDRGGVVIWGSPCTCYVDTINWEAIAPRSRHILSPFDISIETKTLCHNICFCNGNDSKQYCWNNKRCQRFVEGPDALNCHEQCFGCRNTVKTECSVCRYYTERGNCVSKCSDNMILLPNNQYCIPKNECEKLEGWTFNNTCVFECPINYKRSDEGKITRCVRCNNCHVTCGTLNIQTKKSIQDAERCVYINGSLIIHLGYISDAMEDLRHYLGNIQEVSDYIMIYASVTITSLDFLSSLKTIEGRILEDSKYSLLVYDNPNLQTLFTNDITQNLTIGNGTLKMYANSVLCLTVIDDLKTRFTIQPTDSDIPEGMNGYSGNCAEAFLSLQIRVVNDTSAIVMFTYEDPDVTYTLLYVRLRPEDNTIVVPETCSHCDWSAINDIPLHLGQTGLVELNLLQPASTYAVCIETYDPHKRNLARSEVKKFDTFVGRPRPPFLVELVAASDQVVVLRWVDHKDYLKHITSYQLDATLIDFSNMYIRDHCEHPYTHTSEFEDEIDFSRHAVVMRPPPQYNSVCESMCGVLSSTTVGAMVEEDFDICNDIGCDHDTIEPPENSTYRGYVRTLNLLLNSPKNAYQIGNLAPYRSYKFRLRACVNDLCSRSTKGVVKTLPSKLADRPAVKSFIVKEYGEFTVEWDPPSIVNGLVLYYTVQLLPNIVLDDLIYVLPQTWCKLSNETHLVARTQITDRYKVRVCTSSLGIKEACSKWVMADITKVKSASWWWTGMIFGVLLVLFSALGGYRRIWEQNNDDIPLIDMSTADKNESDPPTIAIAHDIQLFSIPLRDTNTE